MSTPSTRTDRALVTRRRMVRAAYDLFCERGYLGTTISEVARLAGVAVPTIYYTFGTKVVLLEESLGAAILGFDRWREPPADLDAAELLPWHHWWAEFDEATTSGEAFDVFFTHGVGILQRVAPLVAALHGAAGDPEAAEVIRISEQRRVGAYREAVGVMAAKPGGLRPGLSRRPRRPTSSSCSSVPSSTSRSGPVEAGPRHGRRRSSTTCCRRSCSNSEPGNGNRRGAKGSTSGEESGDSFGQALARPPGHHEETATGLSSFDPPAIVAATFDGYSTTVHGSSWVHGVSSGFHDVNGRGLRSPGPPGRPVTRGDGFLVAWTATPTAT